MNLDDEAQRLEQLLSGKRVTDISRHRTNEIVVEFSDGSRLVVDSPTDLEISVT